MSLHPVLRRHQRAVRNRLWLEALAIALPIVMACGVLGWRLFGLPAALVLALATAGLLALAAGRRAQSCGPSWLAARLDAASPRFEDSSDLLFQDSAALQGFAALQRRRLKRGSRSRRASTCAPTGRAAESSAPGWPPPW
ncbi:hypothetical protein [Brevundimonas abyssalis]|uniref:Uncharacterized protein n=1 Tax=Brevundimonas abyssalis TAR-001 TaxID=1391729 RepID=A0A8E0TTI5_9CAUL|nr:hypothetical protein [Brevundimonas abyssalis]GAD60296.1 hypothetical protein MBEBAB_2546 [Brevundimonas abyssalis TAR-001]